MVRYYLISIGLILFSSVVHSVVEVAGLSINSNHFELMFIFISYLVLFIGFMKYDNFFSAGLSKFDVLIIGILILWFLINIFRSVDIPFSNLSTMPRFLGGRFYGPALLVPFFVFLGGNISIIRSSWELSKTTIFYYLLFSPLLFIFNASLLEAFIGFLPLIVLNYDKLNRRDFVVAVLVVLIYLAFCIVHGNRTEFVRLSFYLLVAFLFVNHNLFKSGLGLNVKGFVVVIILAVVFLYMYTGNLSKHFSNPVIVENIKGYEKENLNSDSRNMVYEDFADDFTDWKDLIFGRGALGTTFSPQFIILQEISGTIANVFNFPAGYRLEVESGYLQIILKTGLLGFLLFAIISFRAIYLGLFRSRNTLTVMCSFILIERYLSMISFSLPEYSLDYILFWLSIGACLSEKVRNITSIEMYFLLKNGKYYSPNFVSLKSVTDISAKKTL